MPQPYRVIQVGTGGFGAAWCSRFLPPNVADGLIRVVAAADINPAALENARNGLGLPADKCYTDVRRALAENDADFCTIVVPPAHHESVVDAALERGLNVLSEKPIADTLAASLRIAEKIRRAGRKMGVTMSHRFRQDITTLRGEVRSGRHGPLDYLVSRFTCDYRDFASWGKFRHEIPYPLLIEGSVHHLDLLVDLAGAPCETLYAKSWLPEWGQYAGDAQVLILMQAGNGRTVSYEGAKTNAVGLNGWGQEYIRAECRDATLILSHGEIEVFPYDPEHRQRFRREGTGDRIPLIQQPKWANAWLIEQFVRWLDGGPAMETNVDDNLQSVALIFAAIESARSRQPVRVQDFLDAARRDALASL